MPDSKASTSKKTVKINANARLHEALAKLSKAGGNSLTGTVSYRRRLEY
jgi:hypothetical protein